MVFQLSSTISLNFYYVLLSSYLYRRYPGDGFLFGRDKKIYKEKIENLIIVILTSRYK